MMSLDGFGTGDLRSLFFRKQPPKTDIVLIVASDEVPIGDRDYSIDTGVGVWLHFTEMVPLWRLLQTQIS